MMKKIFYILPLLLLTIVAVPVLAATPKTFADVINVVFINGIMKPVVPLLIGLGVIIFIYGVITTMLSEGEKKEEGKEYMMWGIVGIFVMVSVWGLVAIVSNTFQLDNVTKTIKIEQPVIIKQ